MVCDFSFSWGVFHWLPVVFGGSNARDKDGDELAAFVTYLSDQEVVTESELRDEFEPYVGLTELLKTHLELVDEVSFRFRALGLTIVWRRRSRAPDKLSCYVVTDAGFRK